LERLGGGYATDYINELDRNFARIENRLVSESIAEKISEKGVKYAINFLSKIIDGLTLIKIATENSKKQNTQQQKEINAKKNVLVGKLESFFCVNRGPKQKQVINYLTRMLEILISENIRTRYSSRVTSLIDRIRNLRVKLESASRGLEQGIIELKNEFQVGSNVRAMPKEESIVLDVVHPNFHVNFYMTKHLFGEEMFNKLKTEGVSVPNFILGLSSHENRKRVRSQAEVYFEAKLNELNVVDILQEQYDDEQVRSDVVSIISAAVTRSTYLLRLEFPNKAEIIDDNLYCGIPRPDAEIPNLKTIIEGIDPDINFVHTKDPGRIYFFRRVHGIRPEYIDDDWVNYKQHYDSLNQKAKQGVHIFNEEIVEKMYPMHSIHEVTILSSQSTNDDSGQKLDKK